MGKGYMSMSWEKGYECVMGKWFMSLLWEKGIYECHGKRVYE